MLTRSTLFLFSKTKTSLKPNLSKDYYKILGIQKNANKKVIRQSYLKLVKKHHPDANIGNHEKKQKNEASKNQNEYCENFTNIQQAYQILSNELSRQQYDLGTANNTSSYQSGRKNSSNSYSQNNYQQKNNQYRNSSQKQFSNSQRGYRQWNSAKQQYEFLQKRRNQWKKQYQEETAQYLKEQQRIKLKKKQAYKKKTPWDQEYRRMQYILSKENPFHCHIGSPGSNYYQRPPEDHQEQITLKSVWKMVKSKLNKQR